METISIGEVAARTGLAVSAIRFYEERGLVRPDRDAGGRRTFARADIRRLSVIMVAQRLGFSLAEIAAEIDQLPDGRAPTKADWGRMSRTFRRRIDARITELQTLRDKLDACIGCGCLSMRQCALYNRDDTASATGAGPRYLVGERPDR
jgi:MerR family redox-sensitive transcriptional activator SoxR